MPQHKQADHNSQTVESSLDNEFNDDDGDVKTPKKPTVLESWGKVVTLKWRSLNRDDAWNIGGSVTVVGTLAGVAYYMYSNKPGPVGPGIGDPVASVQQDCAICCDLKSKLLECLHCKQSFCQECAERWIGVTFTYDVDFWGAMEARNDSCPYCRQGITSQQLKQMISTANKK